MVMVNTRMKADKRLRSYYGKLGPSLRKISAEARRDFAKAVQKSAKLRAPRWTGFLAKNITVHIVDKDTIEIRSTAPYAVAQEMGFTAHGIKSSTSTKQSVKPIFKQWLSDKGFPIYPVTTVRKHKPHLRPAFEYHIARLEAELDKKVTKGLKRLKL